MVLVPLIICKVCKIIIPGFHSRRPDPALSCLAYTLEVDKCILKHQLFHWQGILINLIRVIQSGAYIWILN